MTAPAPVVPSAPTVEIGYANEGDSNSGSFWSTQEEQPELRWPESVKVFDRMRRSDAQVASVLRAVTLPVRRTPWRLDPAGARPEVTSKLAEDLGLPVQGAQPGDFPAPVRTRDRFSWRQHLSEALLCVQYGFMFFEQVGRIDEEGFWRLRKLAPRMPRSITKINVGRDGGLISIEQGAAAVMLEAGARSGLQPPIPVGRLVAYVNDREGGDWTGTSLLRPAYKHWVVKDKMIRVQAQTIERNGMGIPVYEGGPNETDLSKGEALARSVRSGSGSGAAIPDGAKLNLLAPSGTLPDATPAIKLHDEAIGNAVLAQFLNLGEKSSYALGSTFQDFFTMSLQTLAQLICDTAQQHVIEDWVDWNYGPTEPAPQLVFDEIGSRHQATAEAIKALVDAGVILPDRVTEEAIRQLYGLPPKGYPPPAPITES